MKTASLLLLALAAGCATVRTSAHAARPMEGTLLEVRPVWIADDGSTREVAGLEVLVRSLDAPGRAPYRGISGIEGPVVFSALEPGRYLVEIQASDEVVVVEEVELIYGQGLRLSFDLAVLDAPPDPDPEVEVYVERRGVVREVLDTTWEVVVVVGEILLGLTIFGLFVVLRVVL